MGFLGFTLLLWPVLLPIIIVGYLFEDPAKAVEIIRQLPGFFASLFYGYSGLIFEYIPQKLVEILPGLLKKLQNLM